jgi:hypothetical protein
MGEADYDEDAGLIHDLIDRLETPPALTIGMLKRVLNGDGGGISLAPLARKLEDTGFTRNFLPLKLRAIGYTRVHNDKYEGMWKVNGTRQNIYAPAGMSDKERLKAAAELAQTWREKWGA